MNPDEDIRFLEIKYDGPSYEALMKTFAYYFWNKDANLEGPFKTYEEANKAFRSYYGITGA